jgi:hypothetical protein
MRQILVVPLLVAVVLGVHGQNGQTAPSLPKEDAMQDVEFHEMLVAILLGSHMGAGDGWFHPAQSRYTWEWLAAKHGITPKEAIARDRFRGPADLFARLDRNKDGVLRADDFDWTPPPPPKGTPPFKMPDRKILLKGLFSGELGSWHQGPKLEELAPDFNLRTADGTRRIRLSGFRDEKPVVLVFGSFT